MGFNKRFIEQKLILNTDEDRMGQLFNSDGLIFTDRWSYKFYVLFNEGLSKDTIVKLITNTHGSQR